MDKDSIMTVDESENDRAAQTRRGRHEMDAPSPVITTQGCIYINSVSILWE